MALAGAPEVALTVKAFIDQWQQTTLEQERLDLAASLRSDVLPDEDWLFEQRQMCTDIIHNMPALKTWMNYRSVADEAATSGIKCGGPGL
jgi:hypothetical protein